MNTKTRNGALLLMAIAGVLALAYIWLSFGPVPSASDAPKIGATRNVASVLDGHLVADRVADLGFVPNGRIATITKAAGSTVKTGDILATVESADTMAAVAAARATVDQAQALLDAANSTKKKETRTLSGLHGNDWKVQNAQVSNAKALVRADADALTAAEANAKNADVQLGKTTLRAPFDGIVTRQDGEVGEVAGAAVAPFVTVESVGDIRKVEAFASDLDLSGVNVGDAANVNVSLPGGDKTVSAHLLAIDPDVTDRNGKPAYKATFILDAAESGLRSGMYVGVSFVK